MDTPNWRQIVGGTVGVALLGSIGYFGQARIRTKSTVAPLVSEQQKKAKNRAKDEPTVVDTERVEAPPIEVNAETPTEPTVEPPAPETLIKVDISGEVQKPGVYDISEGLRVEDLVKLAGGLTEQADRNHVNFALKLKDGSKVIVPEKSAKKLKSGSKTKNPDEAPVKEYHFDMGALSDAIGDQKSVGQEVGKKSLSSGQISINRATEADLQLIPGIGSVMAKRIVRYRETKGRFRRTEDIQNVDGMGSKTFEKIRSWISL